MALIHCFFHLYLALFPRVAARRHCGGYCPAFAYAGTAAAKRYVYPAGGRVDVWRIVPVAAGLGSLPFFHGEWCRITAALIQTVTNNEIMFSLHGVYVTTGKCGTFARVVAAFPTVDVKLSAEVMGC